MDLDFRSEDKKFKGRANGVLVHDGKVLGVSMCDNGFFCCPGGHIEFGEDSKTAVLREMKEEAGFILKADKLLCLAENFFIGRRGENFHEIGFYYLLSPQDKNFEAKDFTLVENDKGVLKNMNFKWFELDKLDEVDFRPASLKEKLQSKNFEFEHIIIKDF